MEGADLLAEVRRDASLAGIVFLILSAESEPELPARMRAAGAQGFLEKPLDLQRFFATLEAHLPRPR